jgi:Putative zinc-finger
MTTGWHLDQKLVHRYADGETNGVLAASVEAHLVACGDCRRLLAPAVDPRRLDAVWIEIADTVDTPRSGPLERLLHLSGVRPDTARLLAATPSLRIPWLAAVAGVFAFAALAAGLAPQGRLLFLTVAPLAPVAGVALAFGRAGDPTYEIGVATPYSGFRLLMVRTVAVLATTIGVALTAALLIAGPGRLAVIWLLPALALTTTTLALAERVEPVHAATAVGVIWLAAAVATWLVRAEQLALFGPAAQLTFLALALFTSFAVFRRRDRLAYLIVGGNS